MTDQKFCPQCGESNGADARFCGNCGHEFLPASPAAAVAPVPNARRRGLIAIVIYLVVVIILLIAAWFLFFRNDSEPGITDTAATASKTSVVINTATGTSPTVIDIAPVVSSPTEQLPTTAVLPKSTPPPTPTPTITPTPSQTPMPSITPTPFPTITPTPLPDEIVFQSNRDGDFEIYIMGVDGSNQRPLTQNAAADEYPRVSPDGSRIVFESDRDGNPEIYIMNRDGSGQTRLTFDPGEDRLPTWSPDGRQITFQSERSGVTDLYIVDIDGSNLTLVANTSEREGHTSWSVNDVLVFNASLQLYWQIYIIDVDGSNRQRLTNSTVDEWSPEWSPDGSQILFLSERDNTVNSGIYLMNADGSDVRLVYNSPEVEWGQVWSADGSQIVFTVDQPDGTADIFIMNADGSNATRLIERGAYPSWAVSPTSALNETITSNEEASSVEVVVDGTAMRNDTGLSVEAGQTVLIEYLSGSWQAGPSPTWPLVGPDGDPQVASKQTFPVTNQPVMTLVGGVGEGDPFAVGTSLEWTSDTSGTLWLGPNDDDVTDNSGELIVQVTLLPEGDGS